MGDVVDIDRLMDVIEAGSYRYANEVDLHLGMETVMRSAGYDPAPEVKIDGGRIDFIVGRVGIEVKVQGAKDSLVRQLIRYAACDDLDALLVVTTRVHHHGIPDRLGGKPVRLLQIGGIL